MSVTRSKRLARVGIQLEQKLLSTLKGLCDHWRLPYTLA